MAAVFYQEPRDKDAGEPEPKPKPLTCGKPGHPEAPRAGGAGGFHKCECAGRNARSEATEAGQGSTGRNPGESGETEGHAETNPPADPIRDSETDAHGHPSGRSNAGLEAQKQAGRDDDASALRARPE